mgnify:CR=1 FL=1
MSLTGFSGYLCLIYSLLYGTLCSRGQPCALPLGQKSSHSHSPGFFFAYPIVFDGHGFSYGQIGLTFVRPPPPSSLCSLPTSPSLAVRDPDRNRTRRGDRVPASGAVLPAQGTRGQRRRLGRVPPPAHDGVRARAARVAVHLRLDFKPEDILGWPGCRWNSVRVR